VLFQRSPVDELPLPSLPPALALRQVGGIMNQQSERTRCRRSWARSVWSASGSPALS
jgi:hypothetical protein